MFSFMGDWGMMDSTIMSRPGGVNLCVCMCVAWARLGKDRKSMGEKRLQVTDR